MCRNVMWTQDLGLDMKDVNVIARKNSEMWMDTSIRRTQKSGHKMDIMDMGKIRKLESLISTNDGYL